MRRIEINGHLLKELVANECTRREMAREFRCSTQVIDRKKKELGIRMRPGFRKDPCQRARIMDLVAEGKDNCKKIADCIGINQRHVNFLVTELVGDGLLKVTGRARAYRIELNVEWLTGEDSGNEWADSGGTGPTRRLLLKTKR